MKIRVLPAAIVLCLFANRADLSAQPAKALVIKQGVPYTYNGKSMTPITYSGSKQIPTPKPKAPASNALVIKQGTPYINGRSINTTPTMSSAGLGSVKRPSTQNSAGTKSPESNYSNGAAAYIKSTAVGGSTSDRK